MEFDQSSQHSSQTEGQGETTTNVEAILTIPRFELVRYTWNLCPEILDTAEKEPLYIESTEFVAGTSVGMESKFVLVLKSSEDDPDHLSLEVKLLVIDDLSVKPSVLTQAKIVAGIGDTPLKTVDAPHTEMTPTTAEMFPTITWPNFISIEELKDLKHNHPLSFHILKILVELKVYEQPKTSFQLDPSGIEMALIHVGSYCCEISKKSLSEASPLLAAMLTPNPNSNIIPKEITFDGFPTPYFPHLRSYLEKGEFPSAHSLQMDEIIAFLQLSSDYQITELFHRCASVLAEIVEEANVNEVEELAAQFGCTPELLNAIETVKGGDDMDLDAQQEHEDEENDEEDEEEEEFDEDEDDADSESDDEGIVYDDDDDDTEEESEE